MFEFVYLKVYRQINWISVRWRGKNSWNNREYFQADLKQLSTFDYRSHQPRDRNPYDTSERKGLSPNLWLFFLYILLSSNGETRYEHPSPWQDSGHCQTRRNEHLGDPCCQQKSDRYPHSQMSLDSFHIQWGCSPLIPWCKQSTTDKGRHIQVLERWRSWLISLKLYPKK